MRADRTPARPRVPSFPAVLLAVALMPLPVAAAEGSAPAGPSTAMSLEDIPGSDLKRVILTERAAERLGIEVGESRMETIIRTQMVGGVVVAPIKSASRQITQAVRSDESNAHGPLVYAAERWIAGDSWVRVALTPGEWDRLRANAHARILPLTTRDGFSGDVLAHPSGMPPVENLRERLVQAYYALPSRGHDLKEGDRVRVELQLSGRDDARLVVPYGSIYYDGDGQAWVYLNPEPLVFERRPVKVDFVLGDLAVLTDGPPAGSPVVTVGAALLYGAEVVFKR